MVLRVENLIRVAELAARASAAVKALRKTGNDSAADVLQKECDAACKAIVSGARKRRQAAARARNASRGIGGRFS